MNDWYNIGIIPGILGDLIGTEGDNQLDGTRVEPNQNSTRPIKGPGGNPLAPEEPPDIIEIEEDGTIYVFDADGDYITDYPASEKDYHDIYIDENGDVVHNQAIPPQTSTSTMAPAVDQYGNTVFIDGNGNTIYPEFDEDLDPVQDEDGDWVFVNENGGVYYPQTYMDGNANTIVVHPTTGEHINVDQMNPTTSVPSSAPMIDYAGNTFFVDEDGDYVDINGNPYEPVLNPPVVETYYDELGNLWDSDGNLIKPAPENNGSSNPGITDDTTVPELRDELGNDVLDENTGSSNINSSNSGQQNNNYNPELRDEMGDPIPGISGGDPTLRGDNIINEPDELDSEDEDYIPTTREPVKYDKPTNYNSTIGNRAAYYAP